MEGIGGAGESGYSQEIVLGKRRYFDYANYTSFSNTSILYIN